MVYEYTGYYTSPITLDIYTKGVFIKKQYSNLNLTGSLNNYTINTINISSEQIEQW
jgi:hypothetical protein